MKMYRRNSRRNPWRNTRKKREIPWERMLGFFTIISIPLMIIALSVNIVFRTPDVYQYNLKATQSVEQINVLIEEEKLVNLIGDFMLGKTDEFVLMEEVEYKPEDIFTPLDKEFMRDFRNIIDLFAFIGIAMFIITGVVYFFLIRWRKKETLMKSVKRGGWMLLLLLIFNDLTFLVSPLWKVTWGKLLPGALPEGDLLLALFEEKFMVHVTVFHTVIVGILFGLLFYATWKVAGKRKLFKRF